MSLTKKTATAKSAKATPTKTTPATPPAPLARSLATRPGAALGGKTTPPAPLARTTLPGSPPAPKPAPNLLQGTLQTGSNAITQGLGAIAPMILNQQQTPAAPPQAPPTPNFGDIRTVNQVAPIPNASGAGATEGTPPWMTLLQQMQGFGGGQGGLFGQPGAGAGGPPATQGMGQGTGMGQGINLGNLQAFLANLPRFGSLNMGMPQSLASSLQGGGMPGQGVMGQGGQGGAGMGAGRVGAGQVPALQGQGMQGNPFQALMQQLQGGNQTRFQNAFSSAQGFPFASFLNAGGGFASQFNPMQAMRAFQPGGLGGAPAGLGGMRNLDQQDYVKRQLMASLFGGGGQGAGGGLDVG